LLLLALPFFITFVPVALSETSPASPSSKFFPTLNEADVPVTNVNAPSIFTLLIGHTRPGYNLSAITLHISSSDQRLLKNHQISSKAVRGKSSRIVSAFPTCCAGSVDLLVNATDKEGAITLKTYTLRIEPLKPKFGSR
jgi:hypothetical protein